jgi:hypothetical protein
MPPQECLFLKGRVPETLRLEVFILTSRRSLHRMVGRLSANQLVLSTSFPPSFKEVRECSLRDAEGLTNALQ